MISWMERLQDLIYELPVIPSLAFKQVISGFYGDFFDPTSRTTDPLKDFKFHPFKSKTSAFILEDLFSYYVHNNIKEITGLNWLEFSKLPYNELEMIRSMVNKKEEDE